MTPIQLAVCWDLTPENPVDEPKRTPHIDGSNGSQAPAVFTLVAPDKEGETTEVEEKCDGLHPPIAHEQPLAKVSPHKRSKSAYSRIIADKPKSTISSSTQNTSKATKSSSSYKTVEYCSQECRKYGGRTRNCVACELKNVKIREVVRPKSEYKMAFRAGVPQAKVSIVIGRADIRVPQLRDPYQEKAYCIQTLAPPFSLQNFKRQDYPEHWRLATVYQHSYKPIQNRKKPLLATVYK